MILLSVLQGTQLDRALRSHKLKFRFRSPQSYHVSDSQHILSLQTSSKHTVKGVTITLDAAKQAEWILRGSQGERDEYLQELVAARASEPSTGASSGMVGGPFTPEGA